MSWVREEVCPLASCAEILQANSEEFYYHLKIHEAKRSLETVFEVEASKSEDSK